MLQTSILLFLNIVATYFTYDNLKKTTTRRSALNIKSFLIGLYVTGIAMPLLEESLFRGILVKYLSDVPFSDYINGFIFGLVHAQNYFLHKNILITLFQMISTGYLGYFLVQLDSFLYAYIVHCLYNISIQIISYVAIYFTNDWNIESPKSSLICCRPETLDDIRKPKSEYSYIFIDRNKISKDMLDRIDELYRIEMKRRIANFSGDKRIMDL